MSGPREARGEVAVVWRCAAGEHRASPFIRRGGAGAACLNMHNGNNLGLTWSHNISSLMFHQEKQIC